MAAVGFCRDIRDVEPKKGSREYEGLKEGGSEMRGERLDFLRSSRPQIGPRPPAAYSPLNYRTHVRRGGISATSRPGHPVV